MKPNYRRRYTPPRPENPLTPAAVERLRKIHATCPLCGHEHEDGVECNAPSRLEGRMVGEEAEVHVIPCGCRGLLS